MGLHLSLLCLKLRSGFWAFTFCEGKVTGQLENAQTETDSGKWVVLPLQGLQPRSPGQKLLWSL